MTTFIETMIGASAMVLLAASVFIDDRYSCEHTAYPHPKVIDKVQLSIVLSERHRHGQLHRSYPQAYHANQVSQDGRPVFSGTLSILPNIRILYNLGQVRHDTDLFPSRPSTYFDDAKRYSR